MTKFSLLFLLSVLLGAPGWVGAGEDSRSISLNSVRIDTHHQPSRVKSASGLSLVQFPGPVNALQRRALDDASLRVFTYLPYNSFLVRLSQTKQRAQLERIGAVWSGPYLSEYKVGRGLRQYAEARTGVDTHQMMVQVFPDLAVESVVGELRTLGVPGVLAWQQNPFFSRIRLQMTAQQMASFIDQIAQLESVFWIDLEPRRALLNDTTIWVGQSGLAGGQATPAFAHGIFGERQIVAVLDTGIDPDMCFFRESNSTLPPINACDGGTAIDLMRRKIIGADFLWSNDCSGGIANNEWDSQDHGSHVAGTVAGDNLGSPLLHDPGDGMAPGAKLVIQDGGYAVDNCADLPGLGCPVVDLNPIFQQAYDQGARIHSNSWGDNENAAVQNNYSLGSQDVDEFMWLHPDFLIFFAAGNSGPGAASVGSPSTAKSAVSVGATQRAASANTMAGFSSCGPTDDNRIKPEITVPGASIVSADNDGSASSDNCGTKTSSGTSMATPGAAGLTALIRQYYTDGYYPSGTAILSDALLPSAALLRATLVNSGENMSAAAVMPANCQGWGRVTIDNALYFPSDSRQLWIDDRNDGLVAPGSEHSFDFEITANPAFKVTLAWTDFPSTPAANPHLVNDLDLIVQTQGQTYLGNDWSAGQSTTGGAPDRRNTLEQVLLSQPTPGLVRVTVRGFNLPSGPQRFALVVTGAARQILDPLFSDGFE